MTIDGKIRDEKLQYDITRDTAKTSALSSRGIDNLDKNSDNILQVKEYYHLIKEE